MTPTETQPRFDVDVLKARQKATWESGDFGQVAKYNMPAAEEFMGRLPLRRGQHVLDVACGTGNLAVVAAQRRCVTSGVDIASNLVAPIWVSPRTSSPRDHDHGMPAQARRDSFEAAHWRGAPGCRRGQAHGRHRQATDSPAGRAAHQ